MKLTLVSGLRALALALCLAPACSQEGGLDPSGAGAAFPASSQDASPVAPDTAPPAGDDLGVVMRRVHFAFRREGAAFSGGDATYEARAEGRELRVTPRAMRSADPAGRSEDGAPFIAHTEIVARGPAKARDRDPEPGASLAEDGSLVLEHPAGIEHLRNTEDGVEQSWRFAERPAGSGDLAVRVRVSGERYAGETQGGHHFVDAATGLGVRYGEATWIDARGARSSVPVRWDGEALVLTVPAAVVESAAYPAELDPLIGPEMGTDNPTLVPAPGGQYVPAVACGASACLAVWQDSRAQIVPDIYAARIATNGAVLDPTGIAVCTSAGGQYAPAVAFDGTRWLVAWQDERSGGSVVYAARVDPNGAVLDPNGFALPSPLSYRQRPAVASDGAGFLVAWDENFNGFDTGANIRAARVSSAGAVLDPSGFLVSSATGAQIDPAIGWNGTSYFVAWSDDRAQSNYQIYGARVSSAGTVLDPLGLPINTTESYPDRYPEIASDGGGFFIAWNVAVFTSSNSTDKVMGTRIDALGTPLDPSGVFLGSTYARSPRVAFGGGQYAVAWDRNQGPDRYIHAALVSPTTGAVNPAASLTPVAQSTVNPTSQFSPAIAWDGSRFLLAWVSVNVLAARLDPGLTSLDGFGFLVSRAANTQRNAAVASNGTSYLAVWEDDRASTTEIWATRVDQLGVVLDPAGIKVAADVGDRLAPAVASDGNGFLVVWQDTRAGSDDIYATPVTAAGAVVAPTGIPLSALPASSQLDPAVTFDGTSYLAVWTDARSGSTWDIYGARITPAGAVLDPDGLPIYVGAGSQREPAVASNGAVSLVAWTDSRNSIDDVYAARVTPAGVVLDPTGFGVATTSVAEGSPTVASNGTSFLTAFQIGGDLRATRASAAGALLPPIAFAVSTAAGTQQHAAATWDGASYVLAWDDATDTRGARVSPAGTLLDVNGFAIAPGGLAPAIAGGPFRRALVAYHRFDKTAPSGAVRVRQRTYDDRYDLGAGCSAMVDCKSDHCVDGVCCESACAGACSACNAGKTAVASGTCAPVKNGTDPDLECPPDALACTTGACQGGACGQVVAAGACAISGACWAVGETAPGNECAACAPATATASFTPKLNGTACASDGLACTTDACQAGACAHGIAPGQCVIDGACRASGEANPFNPCEACDPAVSASAWSVKPNGAGCDNDGLGCTADTCQAGACTHALTGGACLIDGSCVAAGAPNPFNLCEACDSTASASTWTPTADGSACTDDGLACTADTCQTGSCQHAITAGTCLISGDCYSAKDTNPLDECAACDPTTTSSAWSTKPEGSACATDGKSCTLDVCQSGLCAHPQDPATCLIDGVCRAAGEKSPASTCEVCTPAANAAGWTPVVPCELPDAGTDGSGGAGASSSASSGSGSTSGAGGDGGAGGASSSTSVGGGGPVCVPGQQVACTCEGQKDGLKVCAADGAGFSGCDCAVPMGTTGSGAAPAGGASDGGCGCTVPGERPQTETAGLGLAALAALLLSRAARPRRRRPASGSTSRDSVRR